MLIDMFIAAIQEGKDYYRLVKGDWRVGVNSSGKPMQSVNRKNQVIQPQPVMLNEKVYSSSPIIHLHSLTLLINFDPENYLKSILVETEG